MKKKLLVLASTFPRWENDTNPPFVYELSKRLANTFDVHVLAPHFPGAKPCEIMDGMNIYRFRYFIAKHEKLAGSGGILPTLKRNKCFYLQVPFFMLGELFALRRLVRKINPDVIHAHWIIPQGLLAVLCKRKSQLITTIHGADIFALQYVNLLKKWVLKRSDRLTAVSAAIKREVERLGIPKATPIDVIPMGVDLSQFDRSRYDQSLKEQYNVKGPLLLFVGRLTEKKGVRYLIEAMPAIVETYPDTKLLVVGDGDGKKALIRQSGTLLNENIIFTGPVTNSDLPRYYATADVFIGPSLVAKGGDTEGLGLVFVEAIGSGCIAIGTDLPSVSDIVADGQTGFIVKQRNATQISVKVIDIIKNKERLKSMKELARQRVVERFDWKVVAKRYEQVLKQQTP